MENSKIEALAEKFTRTVLGVESPKQMCFTVCLPLSIHFKNNGIENSIRVGICEGRVHFWIQLVDGTIVDPTVKQFLFGKNYPLIYFGKKTDDYLEDSTGVDWFDATCETWTHPYCYTEAFLSGGTEFNVSAGFEINTRAAFQIINEIETGVGNNQTRERELYIIGINKILENYLYQDNYLKYVSEVELRQLMKIIDSFKLNSNLSKTK